jgi:hypothetical protein
VKTLLLFSILRGRKLSFHTMYLIRFEHGELEALRFADGEDPEAERVGRHGSNKDRENDVQLKTGI